MLLVHLEENHSNQSGPKISIFRYIEVEVKTNISHFRHNISERGDFILIQYSVLCIYSTHHVGCVSQANSFTFHDQNLQMMQILFTILQRAMKQPQDDILHVAILH